MHVAKAGDQAKTMCYVIQTVQCNAILNHNGPDGTCVYEVRIFLALAVLNWCSAQTVPLRVEHRDVSVFIQVRSYALPSACRILVEQLHGILPEVMSTEY